MNKLIDASAYYLLPSSNSRHTLRSAVMAMNLLPREIAPGQQGMQQLRDDLARQPAAIAIIDLQALAPVIPDVLELTRFFADPQLRCRIVLSRHDSGPVWDSQRDWMRALGFCDLVAQIETRSLLAESQVLLEHVAVCTGAGLVSQDRLRQYFSAMQAQPDTASPRGLIRTLTGLSAESLCCDLAASAIVQDRRHKLSTYPACLVGSEAVTWMAGQFAISRDQCVAIGLAMQSLALLHHVVHEKPFADKHLFFRATRSVAADRIRPQALLDCLTAPNGVKVQDRPYHGRTYESCFVGSEIVDLVHARFGMRRHDCEVALNRLHGFGLIEHVAKAHPVRDGNFFYRFADSLLTGERGHAALAG